MKVVIIVFRPLSHHFRLASNSRASDTPFVQLVHARDAFEPVQDSRAQQRLDAARNWVEVQRVENLDSMLAHSGCPQLVAIYLLLAEGTQCSPVALRQLTDAAIRHGSTSA